MNSQSADQSDAALVTRVRAGDREAFGLLAGRYYASLLRLCVRVLGDPVQAEDFAQEAVLQAFLGLDRLQQPERFGAWLHAIAANLARSSLRRLRTVSLDGLEATGQSALRRAASFPSSEQVVTLRETHDAILAALMELSSVNREAVIGYYLEGYSYAELGSLLGVPVSTVKSRLFKGRQQMRQHLEPLRPAVAGPLREIRKEFSMTPGLIPLQIEMICEYPLIQRSIVVLRTLTDDRYLPIKMSAEEANAIERVLKNTPNALPATSQDTLLQLVSRLGGRIEQILLRSLVDQNYYASLVLVQDGQGHEVDCRLSEALVLAAHARIPVQVGPALLQEAGISFESMGSQISIIAEEGPDSSEPVSTSDQWPETFVEQVWDFLLRVLYKHRTPHDLSRLRSLAWDEIFPARKSTWENRTMQVVQLPGSEPAWLVVRPQIWDQITRFVEWVQQRDTRQINDLQPIFVPLDSGQQKQIEEVLGGVWPALVDLGVRTLALMHLSGQLISWRSLDNYESAVRMGQAALRDLVLTEHLHALVHATVEPGIRLTYERSPLFNPAQAAGANVVSSSETLIHDSWLLVMGWAADRPQNEKQQLFAQIRTSLEALFAD